MNAYEIDQIEKDVKAKFRLPIAYEGWAADVERRAREERARVLGEASAKLFSALRGSVTRLVRRVRSTAADCTDARLRHG